jgi:hypothetical protein
LPFLVAYVLANILFVIGSIGFLPSVSASLRDAGLCVFWKVNDACGNCMVMWWVCYFVPAFDAVVQLILVVHFDLLLLWFALIY